MVIFTTTPPAGRSGGGFMRVAYACGMGWGVCQAHVCQADMHARTALTPRAPDPHRHGVAERVGMRFPLHAVSKQ